MKRVRRFASASGLWLAMLLLGACAGPAATPLPPTEPPAAPEAGDTTEPVSSAPTTEVPVAEITFDGQSCQYEGPEVVREGKLVIVVNDLTDDPAFHMHFFRFHEGKTWQDLLDYIQIVVEAGTSSPPPPPWTTSMGIGALVEDNPNARSFTLRPGLYGSVCARHNGVPEVLWTGAPFEVSASPSG